MRSRLYLLAFFVFLGLIPFSQADAEIAFSQNITLSPGWNIVSTPRILESHSFSVPETNENFDIFALDASKTSGWATLADLGQTEFTPLYGYFVNNKTVSNQILTFNYKADVSPSQRFFDRTFPSTGWYSFGIANPTYSKTVSSDNTDTNNPDHILNSLLGSQAKYSTVIDFTDANPNSVALSDPWGSRIRSITPADATEINKLNDFRETKAYAIYIREADTLYNGFQNNDIPPVPACSNGEDNDGDLLVDLDDPGCINALDNDETDVILEPAVLILSLNNSSPSKQDVVASAGSQDNEMDKLTLLVFDIKAEKDDIAVTDLQVNIEKTGSGSAMAQTVYLFDGSQEKSSITLNGNTAVFSDLNLAVAKDSTKTYTVKIDIRNANATEARFSATASSTGFMAKNSIGDSVSDENKNGSATGYSIGVRNVGPEITLVSKSISTSGVPQGNTLNNMSTSTVTATFNVRLKAVGGDIMLGTVASGTPAFSKSTGFKIYRNGSEVNTDSVSTKSISFTIPSVCTSTGTNSCMLAEGNEINIPVSFQITGRNIDGSSLSSGLYSVALEAVNWVSGAMNTSDFMSGEVDWKTADVSFP
ncbi:MAG: hypothetical protein WCW46_01685 [Candidatus Paceibacterota bacterium]